MTSVSRKARAFQCAPILAACAVVAIQFGAVSAFAGSCPANKVMAADGQRPGPSAHKDVPDTVIASTDLAQEAPKLKDHKFHLRHLVIRPGGIVAWHSHEERPAIIYIISGTVTEYASTCATPIVHKAGDVARGTHTTKQWWKNNTKHRAMLLSADILHDKADQKTM